MLYLTMLILLLQVGARPQIIMTNLLQQPTWLLTGALLFELVPFLCLWLRLFEVFWLNPTLCYFKFARNLNYMVLVLALAIPIFELVEAALIAPFLY